MSLIPDEGAGCIPINIASSSGTISSSLYRVGAILWTTGFSHLNYYTDQERLLYIRIFKVITGLKGNLSPGLGSMK